MKNNILILICLIGIAHISAPAQTTPAQYYKRLTVAELQNYPLSIQRIDGKAGTLPAGTILAFETNKHRKGKLLIRQYGYDLTIDWATYNDNGTIYRSGKNTVVRCTYQFDLDDASDNPGDVDFWWEQVDGLQRYLTPQNGAQFNTFKQTLFDCQVSTVSGPAKIRPGEAWQEPLRVEIKATMPIQAKVYVDLVLSSQPGYYAPVRPAPSYAGYQSGGLVPSGRREVDFSQGSRQVLEMKGILWQDVPPGKYYLLAVVDAYDALHEVNERNNYINWEIDVEAPMENNGNIYPYVLKKIKISDQIEITYVDEGKGDQTLLFIHGLGGYHQVWKKNVDTLRKSYRCIALDLPGYGQSSKGNYNFSLRFYTNVIDLFITKLQLKNVVLVGHSMGGQVAIKVAQNSLPEVQKVVLLAPSGLKVFTPVQRSGIDWLAQPERIKSWSETELRKAFGSAYASSTIPPDAEFTLKYRLNLINKPSELEYFAQMTHKLTMAVVDEPVLEQLSDVRVPTLLLWGEEDKTLSPELTKEAKQHILDCEIHLLSPCGHMVQWECAEEVNNWIREFAPPLSAKMARPSAFFMPDQMACITPCTISFTNISENADRFIWTIDGKEVSRNRDLVFTFKKAEGYRVKLRAYQGSQYNEYEVVILGRGE